MMDDRHTYRQTNIETYTYIIYIHHTQIPTYIYTLYTSRQVHTYKHNKYIHNHTNTNTHTHTINQNV